MQIEQYILNYLLISSIAMTKVETSLLKIAKFRQEKVMID